MTAAQLGVATDVAFAYAQSTRQNAKPVRQTDRALVLWPR